MSGYSFGTLTASSGALVYATGIAPGGCPIVARKSTASYSKLTDAPAPRFGCAFYTFEDLSPIASGSGNAMVCIDDTLTRSMDSCYGIVAWSPSTYIFKEAYSGVIPYVPTTCELQEADSSFARPEYVCSGGSIVRGVEEDGKCVWNGSTLECDDCIPKYAPSACESILGEHPASVPAPAPTGTIIVPDSGAGANPAPSPTGGTNGDFNNHSAGSTYFKILTIAQLLGGILLASSFV